MRLDEYNEHLFKPLIYRWSFRQKLKNPFAGLRGLRRYDNSRAYCIVSRHWPHLLCWSWLIQFQWPDGGKSGLHHKWGIHKRVHPNGGGWFVIGPFWLMWQADDWMVACRRKEEVRQLILKHVSKAG